MAKEKLTKSEIAEALENEGKNLEYYVVLKKEYATAGGYMRLAPEVLIKLTIKGYVRYINPDTGFENSIENKIESFKSRDAAENFIKKNQQIFDFILNDNSKVRLETLRKIVNIKYRMLEAKEKTSDK